MVNKKLYKRLRTVFDEAHIKHMRAYLSLQVEEEKQNLDTLTDIDDLMYAYHKIDKLYSTLQYYVNESEIDNIENEINESASNRQVLCDLIDEIEHSICKREFTTTLEAIKKEDSIEVNDEIICESKCCCGKCQDGCQCGCQCGKETDDKDLFAGSTPYFDIANIDNISTTYTNIKSNSITDFNDYNIVKDFIQEADFKQDPNIKLNIEQDKKNLEKYEMVQHPHHYNTYDVEVIDMMQRIWGDKTVALWCLLTAFKYRMRLGEKPENPVQQDLDKEQWYLKKYKELTENKK